MSLQIPTLWRDGDLVGAVHHARTRKLLDYVKPQGVRLHARGDTLAKVGPSLTALLKQWYPGLLIYWALAGDYDTASVPGHADYWDDAARAALSSGVSALELNCEVHWRHLPTGSATAALNKVHAAAPSLELVHTSYGSVASFPDYPWKEFLGVLSPVRRTSPQIYWATLDGASKPYGYGSVWAARYARSIQAGVKAGLIDPHIEIDCYLQAYECRRDELCATGEDYPRTSWWVAPDQVDADGAEAMAALAELHRRGKTIMQFQAEHGLVKDERVGLKTLEALGLSRAPAGALGRP